MSRPPAKTEHLMVPPSAWRLALGLAVALGGPLLAAQAALWEPLNRFPTSVFFLVVGIAAALGRLSAGLLAIGVSVLVLDWDFVPPADSLRLEQLRDGVALAVFALVAYVLADLIARRDRTAARLRADRARLQFIGEVGDAMARTMDYEERLKEVARLAVPQLGDWCAVHLAENGKPRMVAIAHVDPDKVRLAEELQVRYPPDLEAPTGVPNVIRTGVSELYPTFSRKLIKQAARDAEHLKIIKEVGLRSGLVVPIRSRDTVIGAITLISAESRRTYGPADLALAEELGERAGLALENARLYRERDHIAATLQRALLPPELPDIPGFEMQAYYRAALEGSQVGGDFYDVFPMPDGSWMAMIGDVCGKGPEAASLTGFVRHTVRALAVHEASPAAILKGLNQALLASVEGEQFCTVALARIEPATYGARVVVSVGGHPRPVAVRNNGQIEALGRYGVIVGAFDGATFVEQRSRIRRGETLLLYTDGLTSKDEGDCFADDSRLRTSIAPLAGEAATTIVEAIREHVTSRGEGDPEDDVAVVAVRPLPAVRSAPRSEPGETPAAAS